MGAAEQLHARPEAARNSSAEVRNRYICVVLWPKFTDNTFASSHSAVTDSSHIRLQFFWRTSPLLTYARV
jgi:hypothetical protein